MLLAGVLLLAGCDWPLLRSGPENTGYNPYEPTITRTSVANLAVAWSQPCICPGTPLIAAGRTYVVDQGENAMTAVRAFDAATGAPRWSTPVAGAELRGVANGLVYVVSARTEVVALDASTGATRWTLRPPVPGTGTMTVSHLIVDGSLAFVDGTAAIANANPVSQISAVDPSGRIVWSTTPGGRVAGFAGIRGGTEPDSIARTLQVVSLLPVGDFGTPLVSQYDEMSGTLLRSALGAPSPPAAFPGLANVSASGGLVHFNAREVRGLGSSALFAVDPQTGGTVWSGPGNRWHAVNPHAVVSVAEDRGITVAWGLDARTGTTLWGPVPSGPAPILVGDLVLDTGGALQVRDSRRGDLLASFMPDGDGLYWEVTAANGIIYAASPTRLYAVTPAAASRGESR
jgi:outer membrane protein assembly factor BamB